MTTARGFSLPELLIVVALGVAVTAVALPSTMAAMNRYRLDGAANAVAGEIRQARYTAVTANRTMRVRFNCPTAGAYRVVEVTGVAAIDTAANRCSFPFPDPNPAAPPNSDLARAFLPGGLTFGAVQDLTISPRGLVTPVAGASPAVIELRSGPDSRRITVAASGLVQMP